jgi:hypothetical protein
MQTYRGVMRQNKYEVGHTRRRGLPHFLQRNASYLLNFHWGCAYIHARIELEFLELLLVDSLLRPRAHLF